jgi:hypothetical protein
VPTWLIIVLAVLALLALGGLIARLRINAREEEQFRRELEEANRQLAQAAANDRGWDRAHLEECARRIYTEQSGETEAPPLLLVEVLDRPGTDQDQAVFRVGDRKSDRHLTLGRRDGDWVHESLT